MGAGGGGGKGRRTRGEGAMGRGGGAENWSINTKYSVYTVSDGQKE